MKKMKLSKIISIMLILMLIFTQVSFAQSYSDTNGHWASSEINKWAEKGLLKGSKGLFKPKDNITRAEMAVIIDRLMDYETKETNSFKDLSNTWYTDAILKNSSAGIIKGSNGNVRPKDLITRQEAVVMLSRAMEIEPKTGNTKFNDDRKIAKWAKGYVKSFSELGYIAGKPNGNFEPNKKITRAAVVKIVDNMISEWITTAGEYSEVYTGNVIVNTQEVTLKDAVIGGDLIIAEGVGDGEVNLDNVKISGDIKVRGGGENSIYLKDTLIEGSLKVDKHDGKIRIVASGTTSIKVTKLSSGAMLVEKSLIGGGFEQVLIPDNGQKNSEVIIDGVCNSLDINVPDCTVTILKDAEIDNVNIGAKNTNFICEGTVQKIDIDKRGKGSKINGKGTVKKVNVGANSTTITTKGTEVKTDIGVKGTQAGGKNLAGGGTTTTTGNTPSVGGGGGGSSSSGGNHHTPTVLATSVEINEGETLDIYPSETKTLTATVLPSNTTNKNVTWSTTSSDISVDNAGNVAVNSGVYSGSADVTVTSLSNSNLTDTITLNILADNIKSVGSVSDISQGRGVDEANIAFPTTVDVVCDTNETITANLDPFVPCQGVNYDKQTDGNYQFESTVRLLNGMTNKNSVDLTVVITVIVSDIVDATAPVISSDISDVGGIKDSDISLALSVNTPSDGGTLSYQWYRCDDVNKTNANAITNATSATYEPDTSSNGISYYYCTVTNTNTSATGNEIATTDSSVAKVTIANVVNAEIPVFNNTLSNISVSVGNSFLLDATSTVTDGGTLTYQWYWCDDITGANPQSEQQDAQAQLGFTADQSQVGSYYVFCRVTNTNTDSSITGNTIATIDTSVIKINVVAPIEIDKLDQLALIGNDENYPLDGNYKLTANLDFDDDSSYIDTTNKPKYTENQGFTPIGNNTNPFTGIFDGNNKTITGLLINRTNSLYQGLFGSVTEYAQISDLTLLDANVYGKGMVGGITGALRSGSKVENCKVTGQINGINNMVGGIVGYLDGKSDIVGENTCVKGCFTTADISAGNDYAGGIAGVNQGIINGCFSTGNINAASDGAGGIAGKNSTDASTARDSVIENCYSTGNVSSNSGYNVGGVVGFNETATFSLGIGAIVKNCYSLGSIEGDENIGGIVGNNIRSEVSNCYATGTVTATNLYADSGFAGGIVGTANEESVVKNNIAYASTVAGIDNVERIGHFSNMTDVTLENNYARMDMSVKEDGATKIGTSNSTTIWGADRTNMIATTAPYGAWDFDSDSDGDDAYWKIENGKDRPVLYVGGSKLGNDDGELAVVIPPNPNAHQVSTVADLEKIGTGNSGWDLDDEYILTADIDANSITNWTPLGDWNNGEFQGSFDGAGYTISNLSFNGYNGSFEAYNGYGFFKQIGESGVVKNIVFENPKVNISDNSLLGIVTGRNYGEIDNIKVVSTTQTLNSNTNIAGIAYINRGGTIKNCGVEIDITSTQKIGGIAITNKVYEVSEDKAIIKNCYYSGTIKSENGGDAVGGIAYENTKYSDTCQNAYINNCYTSGNVESLSSACAGGIVAENADYCTVSNCYSTTDVKSGGASVGGVVGGNGANAVVENCYSTGDIIGDRLIGGVVGANDNQAMVKNCVAFNSKITATRTPNSGQPDIEVARVLGYNPNLGAGTINNNYAKDTMSILHPNGSINPNIPTIKNADNAQGADISNMTSINKSPLSSWEFDSDDNGDGAYWKIESGKDRPVLYTNDGTGNFNKLGEDDGLIVGVIPTGPFDINTVADLQKIGNSSGWTMNATYNLRANIDLNSVCNVNVGNWTPIGTLSEPFSGRFNGNGFKIDNLYIVDDTASNIGLFGITDNARIDNLILTNVTVQGDDNVGAFVGKASDGSYLRLIFESGAAKGMSSQSASQSNNSSNVGGIVGYGTDDINLQQSECRGDVYGSNYSQNIGGIVGKIDSGSVSHSFLTGSVDGENTVGGIAGLVTGNINSNVRVATCFVENGATVEGDSGYIGGIAGEVISSDIKNSYVKGNVLGNCDVESVGGIVGHIETGNVNTSTMTNDEIDNLKGDVIGCYSAGEVKVDGVHSIVSELGGIVGKSNGGIITFCYSLGDLTGFESNVGGLVGYNGSNTDGSCAGQIHSSYAKSALSINGSLGSDIGIGGIAGKTSVSSVVSKSYAINDSITYDDSLSYIKYNAIAGIGNGGIQDTQYKINMISNNQGAEMLTSSIVIDDTIAGWDYTQDINQGDDGYWWLHQTENPNQVALRPVLMFMTNQVGDDDGSNY